MEWIIADKKYDNVPNYDDGLKVTLAEVEEREEKDCDVDVDVRMCGSMIKWGSTGLSGCRDRGGRARGVEGKE